MLGKAKKAKKNRCNTFAELKGQDFRTLLLHND